VGPWNGSRFSLAVDYFDIEVQGEVTTLGAANIVFTCFNAEDYPNAPECALFDRESDPTNARFNQIITVRNPYLNINSQRNRGVDFTARFNQDLGSWGSFSLLGQATWQLEDEFELFAGAISNSEGEVGEPEFVGNLRATYVNGPWSVFYGIDYVSGVSNEQDVRNISAGAVCASSPLRGGLVCPIFEYPAQFYHSMSVTRSINERFTITFGLNNIFDTAPPRASAVFGANSVTGQVPTFGTQYDLVGRRAFISVRARM
jgi:iron complex outermembrane receptor protein